MDNHPKIRFKILPYSICKNKSEYLTSLNNNFFSTPENITYGNNDDFSLLIVLEKHRVKCTFAFRTNCNTIKILNSVTKIDPTYLEIACAYLLNKYKEIKSISIANISTEIKQLHSSHFAYSAKEDIVITLPTTEDIYMKSLGKKTRKHLNQYLFRLNKQTNFKFQFVKLTRRNNHYLEKIMDMNKLRMEKKNRKSNYDEPYKKMLYGLGYVFGWCGLIKKSNEVVAGTFLFHTKDDYYLQIISHNPDYNYLELGQVVLLQTVKEVIKRKGERLHLLWGNSQYKYRFLGVRQNLFSVIFFRSRQNMFQYVLPRLPTIYGRTFFKYVFNIFYKNRYSKIIIDKIYKGLS